MLFASAQAAETYGPYKAKVLRVLDGYTVQVDVAIWPRLSKEIKVRLLGVDTPETRGRNVPACEQQAGQSATAFTNNILRGETFVKLSDVSLGKYAGQVLGNI